MSLSWFAVYAEYRAEFKAEATLVELGLEAYCPREKRNTYRHGVKRVVEAPLLPRYLFVGLAPTSHGPDGKPEYPFDVVKAIDGVAGIIGIRGAPVQIPHDAPDPETERERKGSTTERRITIGELKLMELAGDFDHTKRGRAKWRKAQRVRITGGAFSGFIGIITEDPSDERKVRVETDPIIRGGGRGKIVISGEQLEEAA